MASEAITAGPAAPTGVDVTIDLVAGRLDSAFLEAGSALASAYDLVETLIASLSGVAGALDRDAASRAVANMQGMGGRIAQVPQTVDGRAAALADIAAASAQVDQQMFGVRRTIEFLRICGLNIKVASGGQQGFSGFADQMLARLDRSEVEISAIRREAKKLQAMIPTVVAGDRRLAAECAAIAADVPRNLEANALALQDYLNAADEQSVQVTAIACRLRAQLAEALGAIQIGDITRQRLEHVATGFRLLAAYGDPSGGESSGQAKGADQVLGLLQALCAAAVEDFERESRKLFDCQRLIGVDIADVLALRQSEGSVATSGDLLRALESEVAGIGLLTQGLREADRRSHALGGETIATAQCLGQRLALIDRITAEVDNMAWNTDIRCYRMGEAGRGLARIAQEIRGLVGTLEEICERVDAAVIQVNGAAMRIAGDIALDEGDGQTLEESLAIIGEGAKRANASLAQLDRQANCAAEVVDTAGAAIARIEELCTPLQAMAGELDRAAGSQPYAGIVDVDEARALLDGICRLYTMESERQIHRRFLPSACEQSANVEPTPDDDEDDGLF